MEKILSSMYGDSTTPINGENIGFKSFVKAAGDDYVTCTN